MLGPTNATDKTLPTNVVTIDTAQTITGAKTFYNPVVTSDLSLGDNDVVPLGAPHLRLYSTRKIGDVNNQNLSTIEVIDGNSVVASQDRVRAYSSYIRYDKYLRFDSSNVTNTMLVMQSDGTAYMTVPTRAYNSANTSDVVTIGSLQASTDVVHRSGDETIAGNKTLTGNVYISNAGLQVSSANYPNIFVKDTNSVLGDKVAAEYGALVGRDSNDTRMAECRFVKGVSGGTIERVIALLRAYHPTTPTTSSQTLQVVAYDDGTGAVLGPSPVPTQAAYRNITISQSSPTGGNNGDIWIQY